MRFQLFEDGASLSGEEAEPDDPFQLWEGSPLDSLGDPGARREGLSVGVEEHAVAVLMSVVEQDSRLRGAFGALGGVVPDGPV